MPLNSVNFWASTRDAHRNTCKAKTPASRQVPGAGLVHGAVVPKGGSAAASTTSERPPAGTCDMESLSLPDGNKNHLYQAKGRKVPPAKVDAQQPSLGSARTEGPAAGPVGNGGFPCWVSDGVATKQGADALPTGQISSAARKKQRKKKSNHKKRNEVANQEAPPPPPPPPPLEEEEEDWESEIQEVSVQNWGEMCFGTCSYGPEDVLDWSMRSSTLNDWATVIAPMRNRFKPFACHPQPLQWFHFSKLPETDQFEDAEE